jgi:hypothetical protein
LTITAAPADACPAPAAVRVDHALGLNSRAVLHYLRLSGPAGARKVAQALDLPNFTVIAALCTMAEKGLVVQQDHEFGDLWAAAGAAEQPVQPTTPEPVQPATPEPVQPAKATRRVNHEAQRRISPGGPFNARRKGSQIHVDDVEGVRVAVLSVTDLDRLVDGRAESGRALVKYRELVLGDQRVRSWGPLDPAMDGEVFDAAILAL